MAAIGGTELLLTYRLRLNLLTLIETDSSESDRWVPRGRPLRAAVSRERKEGIRATMLRLNQAPLYVLIVTNGLTFRIFLIRGGVFFLVSVLSLFFVHGHYKVRTTNTWCWCVIMLLVSCKSSSTQDEERPLVFLVGRETKPKRF